MHITYSEVNQPNTKKLQINVIIKNNYGLTFDP